MGKSELVEIWNQYQIPLSNQQTSLASMTINDTWTKPINMIGGNKVVTGNYRPTSLVDTNIVSNRRISQKLVMKAHFQNPSIVWM